MNGEPRQHINLVLYARAILSISELVLTVKACAVLFNYASECVPVSAVLVVKGKKSVPRLVGHVSNFFFEIELHFK